MEQRWTAELPHDVEPLSEHHGSRRGRLRDGSQVMARVVLTQSEEEGRRLVADLRATAASLADPRLVPVVGAVAKPRAVWVLSEAGGVSLRSMIESGGLPVPLAVAAGLETLAGLAALQAAGLTHGDLHAGSVHVSCDGRVRLADYALHPRCARSTDRPGWGGDPDRDVAAAGALVCAALGVPARTDGGELLDAERAVPAFVTTARSLAAGRGGPNAAAALAALRAAAGRLAVPATTARHLQQLGELVAVPGIARAPRQPPARLWVPARPMPVARAAPPARSERRAWRPALTAALILGMAGLAIAGIALGIAAAPSRVAARSAGVPAPRAVTTRPATSVPDGSARAATPEPSAIPTPVPVDVAAAGSPDAAVSRFYQLVAKHRFDAAVQLWSARMQAAYPPGENVYQRFADTTALTLVSDQVTAPADSTALVSVSVLEVRAGQTYRWVGTWYVVRGSSGWLLDQPSLRAT